MNIKILQLGLIFSNLMNPSRGFSRPSTPLSQKQLGSIENKPLKATNSQGNYPNQEDLSRKEELNKAQFIGVKQYELTEKEVQTTNFGYHTLLAMSLLMENGNCPNYQKAFARVEELNEAEAKGVSQFHLTREEVEGLNIDQIRGVFYYQLTREQVENSSYNKNTFDTMLALQFAIPQAAGLHLYETSIEMKNYQIRGIAEHGLTLKQIGIGISDHHFVKQNPENPNFSKDTIKTLEFLKSQNLSNPKQEAYNIAINQNLSQVKGLILYGFSLEQVNTKQYKDLEDTILDELTKNIQEKIGNFSVPLTKEQQVIARNELDKILKKEENQGIEDKNFEIGFIADNIDNWTTPVNKTENTQQSSSTRKGTGRNNNQTKKNAPKKGKGKKKQ